MRRTTVSALALIACLAFNLCVILPAGVQPQGKGQVQAFNPFDVGSPQFWYEAGSIAQADAATVASWPDKSGNSRTLLQATGTNQPTLNYGAANGRAAVRFDGVDNYMVASFTRSQPHTTFLVVRQYLTGDSGSRFMDGGSVNGSIVATNQTGQGRLSLFAGSAFSGNAYGPPLNEWVVVQATFDGASSTIQTSGNAAFTSSPGTGAAGGVTLGGAATGNVGLFAKVDVAEVIGYSGAMSNTSATIVRKALEMKYRVYQKKLVVFEGDSTTQGGSCGDIPYPTQVLTSLGSSWQILNKGTSGETLATMLTQQGDQVLRYVSSYRSKNVAVLLAGTNDLYAGTAAATVTANLQTWLTDAKASTAYNGNVVWVSILPRSSGGTPGGFEAARQTVNADMRVWCAANGVRVADAAANTTIGDAGDETNATYYCDLVHLTTAGNAILAGLVVAEISAL